MVPHVCACVLKALPRTSEGQEVGVFSLLPLTNLFVYGVHSTSRTVPRTSVKTVIKTRITVMAVATRVLVLVGSGGPIGGKVH